MPANNHSSWCEGKLPTLPFYLLCSSHRYIIIKCQLQFISDIFLNWSGLINIEATCIFRSIIYWGHKRGYFLLTTCRTNPPLPPPSSLKSGKIGFWSKKMRNVLKRIKKQFTDVLKNWFYIRYMKIDFYKYKNIFLIWKRVYPDRSN